MQGCVDSRESLTGEDRPELSGTTKEVIKRNNTDRILDRLINWQYLLPPIKLFYKGATLSSTPFGIKRTPVTSSSVTNQLCILPEQILQPEQIGPHSIGFQDFHHAPPVNGVICLLEIHIDLVERALIMPCQLLGKLSLNQGCPCSPFWKASMKAIMEFNQS